jgi:hypothetical protein
LHPFAAHPTATKAVVPAAKINVDRLKIKSFTDKNEWKKADDSVIEDEVTFNGMNTKTCTQEQIDKAKADLEKATIIKNQLFDTASASQKAHQDALKAFEIEFPEEKK